MLNIFSASHGRTAGCKPAARSLKRQHVLDAARFAEQEVLGVFQFVTARDDGAHRLRPAFHENAEVVNRIVESITPRVHRANHDLVLEHHVPHDELRVDVEMRQWETWNPSEYKDTVESEHL